MVLLTMTSAVVEALESIKSLENRYNEKIRPRGQTTVGTKEGADEEKEATEQQKPQNESCGPRAPSQRDGMDTRIGKADAKAVENGEPPLQNAKIGNPIRHGQIMDLAKEMKSRGLEPCRLEILLKGSRVYIPPPPAKPEPTSEYKALMARLRRDEEARFYERMTKPPPPMETFSQRFHSTSAANAFSSNHPQTSETDDENTYADIDRQVTLIFNVLVSIVACAAAIWVAARWWSTPMRLALSMSGSMLVGVAEVVVYAGYIRRVGEAKGNEKKLKEVKQVVNTWVVGAGESANDTGSVKIEPKVPNDVKTRRRK